MYEVRKVRESLLERTKDIMEILETEQKPIGFTDLLIKLRERRQSKVSSSTLSKCLNLLVYKHYVDKKEIKDRGNPVLYSVNSDHDAWKLDRQIRHNRNILKSPEILKNKGPYGFEEMHFRFICMNLLPIILTLIKELYVFSHTASKRKAIEHYSTFLETQFIPALFEITELIAPPLEMSEKTRDALINEISVVPLNYIFSKIERENREGKTNEERNQEMKEGFEWFGDVMIQNNLLHDYDKQPTKYNKDHH